MNCGEFLKETATKVFGQDLQSIMQKERKNEGGNEIRPSIHGSSTYDSSVMEDAAATRSDKVIRGHQRSHANDREWQGELFNNSQKRQLLCHQNSEGMIEENRMFSGDNHG